MDLLKWQNVLVEWINCLNLVAPVQQIKDLQNADFFTQILSKLTQNSDLEEDNAEYDSNIFDFLKKRYPAYKLESECTNVLDSLEMTYACSLLLHYCCIVDGRAQFIGPPCEGLSQQAQLHVKTFLEEMPNTMNVTRDTLIESIINTQKLPSTPIKAYANSPCGSPMPNREGVSPLLEFLKTPVRKFHHKKEVNMLLAQLDMERFEKADLQEELNQQYEKNKILDKKVAEKVTEISRLRSELLSLENTTEPSSNNTETKFEHKRLRAEISSLEKYVEILHQEQAQVQIDRDTARERLRRIEEQCASWQDRCLQAERLSLEFSEEQQRQQQELAGLRSHCEELTRYLTELRTNAAKDESYEMDSSISESNLTKSGPIDCQSLADTVVDLKLVDAEQENSDLRRQLTELEVKSTDLTCQVTDLQARLSVLHEQNTSLLECNDSLHKKVYELSETQKYLKDVQAKLQDQVSSLTIEKTDLNSVKEELNTKLREIEAIATKSKEENARLLSEIQLADKNYEQLMEELHVQTDKCQKLISSNDNLQFTLNESIHKALNYESENCTLKITLEKFNCDLQNYLTKLELQVTGTETETTDGIMKLKALIEYLEIKNKEHETCTNTLKETCATLTDKIVELSEEIASLNKNESLTKDEIAKLKTCLSEANSKIQHFEKVVVVHFNNQIEEYEAVITNKNKLITELTGLKDEVLEKEILIKNLEVEKSDLENDKVQIKQEFETDKEQLTSQLREYSSRAETLQTELTHLKESILNIASEILSIDLEKQNMQTSEETLQVLRNHFKSLRDEINAAVDKKQKACEELEVRRQDLVHLKNVEKEHLNEIEEYKKLISTRNGEILIMQRDYEAEMLRKNIHLENVQKTVKNLEDDIEKLRFEKGDANNQIVYLHQEIDILHNVKNDYEKQHSENIIKIEELNTLCTNLEREKAEVLANSESLRKELHEVRLSLIDTQSLVEQSISHRQADLSKYEQDVEQLRNENNDLEKALKKVQSKENKTAAELISVKNELADKITNFTSSLEEKENARHQCEVEALGLRSKLEELSQMYSDLVESHSEITLKLEHTRKQVELQTEVRQDLENNISALKLEQSNIRDQLQAQVELLTRERDNLKVDVNKLYEELASFKLINSELEENILVNKAEKENLSEELCIKTSELQARLTEFNSKKSEWVSEIKGLQNRLMFVEKERQKFKNTYDEYVKDSNKKLAEVQTEYTQQLQQLQAQKEDLTNKLHEMQESLSRAERSKEEYTKETLSVINEKKNLIQKLSAENSELKGNVSKVSEDMKILEVKLSQVEEDFQKLQSSNENQNAKYETTVKELEDTKTMLERVLELVTNMKEMLEKEVLSTSAKIISAEESVSKTTEKYAKDLEAKDNVCTKLMREIEYISTRIVDVLTTKTELESELTTITERILVLEQKKQEAAQNYETQLEELISEHKRQLENLEIHHKNAAQFLEHSLQEKSSDINEKVNEIARLNTTVLQTVQKMEILGTEKRNLMTSLQVAQTEISALKQSQKELFEYQSRMQKEVEEHILQTQEFMTSTKKDFANRISELENKNLSKVSDLEQENEQKRNEITELKKQLETVLIDEANKTSFLEKRIEDLSSERDKMLKLCAEYHKRMHDLYEVIIVENHAEKVDTVSEKRNLSTEFETLYSEREKLDEKCSDILNETSRLKKLSDEVSNYEVIKLEYFALKEKYEILSTREAENNSLKSKFVELENKLSDLELENAKYQNMCSEQELEKVHMLKERENMREKYEEKLAIMKASCANWQKLSNDKDSERDKIANERVILKEKTEELIQQLNTIEDERNNYKTMLLKSETEMKNLKETNNQALKEHAELEIKMNVLQEKVTKEEKEREKIVNERIKEKTDEIVERLKAAEDESSHYKVMLIKSETEFLHLKETYNKSEQQRVELEARLEIIEEKAAKHKQFYVDSEKEYHQLMKRFDELSERHKLMMDKFSEENETDKKELENLRSAYVKLQEEYSRLERDISLLQARNDQLSELSMIREKYEKILEENNKVNLELDTLRYKRTRDKEEFKRLLDEQRTKSSASSDERMQEIRKEYEDKLKKMKEKVVKLYQEEMEKSRKKIATEQQDHAQAVETIKSLKSQLWVTSNKYAEIKKENERLIEQMRRSTEMGAGTIHEAVYNSRDSVCSLQPSRPPTRVDDRRSLSLPRDPRPQLSQIPHTVNLETMNSVTVISQASITATSASSNLDHGLRMEDEEGELFNNTFLSDLKAGRCVPSGTSGHRHTERMSELQFRNSMCPPHLKSSYPAETQFSSPSQFKEEDLKTGNAFLDDSMSSSLLPGEKPRTKKDWGQTLYKKPGPPTPSKNGGRLSLQGSEVQARDVLREHNVPRAATPSRIKALFMSRSHNNTEVGHVHWGTATSTGTGTGTGTNTGTGHSLVPLISRTPEHPSAPASPLRCYVHVQYVHHSYRDWLCYHLQHHPYVLVPVLVLFFAYLTFYYTCGTPD